MKDRWKILIVCIIIGTILAGIALFLGFSFKKVNLRQYGLLYYNFYNTVDQSQSIRTNGNYLVGLDYDFYTYPKGLLKYDFNIEILTKDKSIIEVQGLFIGQLIQSEIINLHFSYGPFSYMKIIQKNIEQTFRETIEQFMLNELISDRMSINSYVYSSVCLNIQSRYSFINCLYVSTGQLNIHSKPVLIQSQVSIQEYYKKILQKTMQAQKKINIYSNGGFNLIENVQKMNAELFFNSTSLIINTISTYTKQPQQIFAGAMHILDNALIPTLNNRISVAPLMN